MSKYQKNRDFSKQPVYKNRPDAEVDFKVGDIISTEKDGIGQIDGEVIAIHGQQLTCSWEYGTFYAWSWQSKKIG